MLLKTKTFDGYFSSEDPISLMACGDEDLEPDYLMSNKKFLKYVFVYINQGKKEYLINDKKFIAKKGDIILIPKNSFYSYKVIGNEKCRNMWFVFDGTAVENLIDSYLVKDKYCFFCKNSEAIFSKTVNLKAENSNEYLILSKHFSMLLQELLISIFEEERRIKLENENAIEKIKRYIDENILEDLDVSTIANIFGYSINYTIFKFKEYFGITPNKYINKRKIEISCLYLANTNLAIKRISDYLSFTDQHYFSNVFSKTIGMTPSEYRKNMLINKDDECKNNIIIEEDK